MGRRRPRIVLATAPSLGPLRTRSIAARAGRTAGPEADPGSGSPQRRHGDAVLVAKAYPGAWVRESPPRHGWTAVATARTALALPMGKR